MIFHALLDCIAVTFIPSKTFVFLIAIVAYHIEKSKLFSGVLFNSWLSSISADYEFTA
jgi:hypothetical protein